MIGDLKPYPAYKNSGVPWLGEVPEHWEVRRLRDSIDGCINGIWGNEPNGREDLPCVRVADFDRWRLRVKLARPTMRAITRDERRRRMLENGDLLLEKSGGGDLQPVGVVMLYDHDVPAVCSNFVARMPVAAGFNSGYLAYLHAHLYAVRLNVRSIKQTTGIQNLDSSAYLSEPIAFAPLPEQAAIVGFLDHADRRIRRYIRVKQKLIKLLEEQKQAIIRLAVTRGLDPNVRLKPSGVEWLGDVPQHWEVARLSQFFTLQRGFDITKEQQRKGVIPVVSSGGVSSYHDRPTSKGPGVLVGRKGTAGAVHFVETDYWAHDTTLWVNDFKGNWPRFIYHALVTLDLKRFDTGSANPTLNRNVIHPEKLAFPPPLEQVRIAAAIDEGIVRHGALGTVAQREISLIREFRTCLIADVVTGKLDVRDAAAKLPDEPEEPDLLEDAGAPEEIEEFCEDMNQELIAEDEVTNA